MELTILNVKEVINFINEPVVVISLDKEEIFINDIAKKRLFSDFSEEDTVKIIHRIFQKNDEYFEIKFNKKNYLISNKNVIIEEKEYQVSTILDITKLKNTQNDIKVLKNHLITKISQNAQETNTLKEQYGKDIEKLKHQIVDDSKFIDILKNRVELLDKKNQKLQDKISQLSKDNFSFEDLLELEISRAKTLNTKFTLVLISIDKFDELSVSYEYRSKMDIIIKATLRYFKNTLRDYDMVQYVDNGMFYMIIANRVDFNVSKMITHLTKERELIDKLTINFTSGMSHFYKTDNVEKLVYRCMKDHDEHKAKNNKEEI